MATLSNPTFYRDGKTGEPGNLVGFESQVNRVARYTLTMGSDESATSISIFLEAHGWIQWGTYSAPFNEINKKVSLYFAISTDPDEFANAGKNDVSRATGKVTMEQAWGSQANQDVAFNARLAADVNLLPGQVYYLWLFPGYNTDNGMWGYFTWYDNGTDRFTYHVEISGELGLVYIHNGAGFEEYQVYIHNGSGWDLYIPYIHDGVGWQLCAG